MIDLVIVGGGPAGLATAIWARRLGLSAVVLERRVPHPRYGKQVKVTKRVQAHDDKGAGIGDKVRIMETRPLSKTKRWRVVDIVTRAQ